MLEQVELQQAEEQLLQQSLLQASFQAAAEVKMEYENLVRRMMILQEGIVPAAQLSDTFAAKCQQMRRVSWTQMVQALGPQGAQAARSLAGAFDHSGALYAALSG